MAAVFLYRCPNTGLNVQGRIEGEPTDRETDLYEAVTCTACARVHLVNPKTGRLFGEEVNKPSLRAPCGPGTPKYPHG
jgi:hypothetical protein